LKNLTAFKLVLGSGSPRRKQLLSECGFEFSIRTREIDETPPAGLLRSEIAMKLAEMKSDALLDSLADDEILITADTIVCLNEQVLNKPFDEPHAIEMLNLLNGKIHQVYTGVCIVSKTKKVIFYCETDVEFNSISDELILKYIREFSPFDKAGSYGAQECLPAGMNPCSETEKQYMISIGKPELFENTLVQLKKENIPIIKNINGSYFNVMGFPVVELSNQLKAFIS
jgi:septum formation protein